MQSRDQTVKNTTLKKITKIIKYIYEVCFKNRIFFLQGNSYKIKIKGVLEDLKLKKIK